MLIMLSISFSYLPESYFPCHLIHMTFLKTRFRWCQAQNTHKSPVWYDPLKIFFFFFRNVKRKQKKDITIISLPVIQKQIHKCTITLLERNNYMGRSLIKKCELIDWIMLPTCTVSDKYLNVHVHIHWGGSQNPSLTC